MYNYVKSGIDTKCYDVYLRKHALSGVGHWASLPSVSPWTLDGFIPSDVASETSLVVYKDDTSTTNGYVASADACWVKIGVLDGSPTIVTAEGTKLDLATCNNLILGKKIDIDFTSISVNYDNWEEMLTLEDSGTVDVLYVETGNITDSTLKNGVGVADLQVDVNLNIKGNDVDRMPFKLSKEVPRTNIRKFLNFVDVQL